MLFFALPACTSYVWSSPDRLALEQALNRDNGALFSDVYPNLSEDKNMVRETDNLKEYLINEYRTVKYENCSWVVKVNKNSNIIESWHYSSNSCNQL